MNAIPSKLIKEEERAVRFVRDSEKTWQVAHLVTAQGGLVVSTGADIQWIMGRRNHRGWTLRRKVIVDGAFSVEKPGFRDVETGEHYEFSRNGPMRIIEAIADGRLRPEAGLIRGLFSFEKMGKSIFLVPAETDRARRATKTPQPIEEDAPDITAFIPPRPRK